MTEVTLGKVRKILSLHLFLCWLGFPSNSGNNNCVLTPISIRHSFPKKWRCLIEAGRNGAISETILYASFRQIIFPPYCSNFWHTAHSRGDETPDFPIARKREWNNDTIQKRRRRKRFSPEGGGVVMPWSRRRQHKSCYFLEKLSKIALSFELARFVENVSNWAWRAIHLDSLLVWFLWKFKIILVVTVSTMWMQYM